MIKVLGYKVIKSRKQLRNYFKKQLKSNQLESLVVHLPLHYVMAEELPNDEKLNPHLYKVSLNASEDLDLLSLLDKGAFGFVFLAAKQFPSY